MARLLPVGKGHPGEGDGTAAPVPVHVVVHGELADGPVAVQEVARVPKDDVALEREGKMVFGAGALHLGRGRIREDVVLNQVVLAVVLVEAAGLGVVHDVVFRHNVRRALVEVDPPAAIGGRQDVVNEVVRQAGAVLVAQRVDAAHVAEQAAPDVVDVVVFDDVVLRQGVAVAPGPADGDARVIQVMDVVVDDAVAGTLPDPDADGGRMDRAAVVNAAVLHDVPLGDVVRVLADARLADLDAARAQVVQVAADDRVPLAGPAPLHGVGADVGDLAVLQGAVPRADAADDPAQIHLRLGRRVPLRPHRPVGVPKEQAPQVDVRHPVFAVRVALEHDQLLEAGRDRLERRRRLARQRMIIDDARRPVQIPGARLLGQCLKDVLHPVAVALGELRPVDPGWTCDPSASAHGSPRPRTAPASAPCSRSG